MLDSIEVCTVVVDETPYMISGVERRKNELMVVTQTAAPPDMDFIVLSKFIVLGAGKADIRTLKMKYSEFKDKVEKGDYKVVSLF